MAEGTDEHSAPRGWREALASTLTAFEGPGTIAWVSVTALAMSVFFFASDLWRGRSFKLLGAPDVVFFLGLFAAHLLLDAGGQAWLEKWVGEISNITLSCWRQGPSSCACRSPCPTPATRLIRSTGTRRSSCASTISSRPGGRWRFSSPRSRAGMATRF